jgi:hypothetical protein
VGEIKHHSPGLGIGHWALGIGKNKLRLFMLIYLAALIPDKLLTKVDE